MAVRLFLVLTVALLSVSCASSHRLLNHDEVITFERAFAQYDSSAKTAEVTLSYRSENLRGKVAGVVTRASSEAYRIELLGHGNPFLKAYVTQSKTIIWPEGGSPLVMEEGCDVMLSEMIEGLPDWPLRCCLPLVFPSRSDSGAVTSRGGIPASAELELCDQSELPLVVKYSGRNTSINFPYKKIVIEEPGSIGRLVWRFKP